MFITGKQLYNTSQLRLTLENRHQNVMIDNERITLAGEGKGHAGP